MGNKQFYESIATLIGCTIGAGILAIPYVISQAGLLAGIIDIIILGLSALLINLYLGEVVLRTKGKHQLTGYAQKYLGKNGRRLMVLAMIIGIYSSLIAYLIGEGSTIASLFSFNQFIGGMLFFFFVAIILFIGLKAVERSELMITGLMVLVLILIIFLAYPSIKSENVQLGSIKNLFVPYGVIFFAFIGTAAIPEMSEIIGDQKKQLKKAILIGTLIPLVIYLAFSIVVVGVVGLSGFNSLTGEKIATIALGETLGTTAFTLANLFALLSMTTSFIALGMALKEMYMYDYKIRESISWLLVILVPLAIFVIDSFFIDVTNFIQLLSLSGAITGGLTGILIIIMVNKAVKKGDRKPEYTVKKFPSLEFVLIILFILGVVYEVLRTFGVLKI